MIPVLAMLLVGERRSGRVRTLLSLRRPGRGWTIATIAAVCLAGGLLALAAARPVVNTWSRICAFESTRRAFSIR